MKSSPLTRKSYLQQMKTNSENQNYLQIKS